MLSLTTLLPTPHGGRVTSEDVLWERVVEPFLQRLGYAPEQLRRHRDPSWSRAGFLVTHTAFSSLTPDLLMLLEVGRSVPGELLDQAIGMATSLPQVPPLVALVYPQRAGFVLAAFVTHTRLPWGGAFPEPQELRPLVQGLRQQVVSQEERPESLSWQSRWDSLLAREGGAPEAEQVATLVGWSDALLVSGQYREAQGVLQRLLTLATVQNSALAMARVRRDLGLVFSRLEHWPDAEQALLQALDSYRQLGELGAWGATLLDLAAVQLGQNRPESAEMLLREALAIAQQHQDATLEGAVLNNLAQSWMAQERLVEAAEALEKALAITQAQGQPREEVFARYNLAAVYQQLGRSEAAQRLVKEVKHLSTALGPIE